MDYVATIVNLKNWYRTIADGPFGHLKDDKLCRARNETHSSQHLILPEQLSRRPNWQTHCTHGTILGTLILGKNTSPMQVV